MVVEDEVSGELVEVGEEGEAVVGLDLVEPVGEDLQQGVVEDCWENTFGSSWFRKPLMPSTAFSPTEQCERAENCPVPVSVLFSLSQTMLLYRTSSSSIQATSTVFLTPGPQPALGQQLLQSLLLVHSQFYKIKKFYFISLFWI